jgi:hypothetical protein
VDVGVDYFLAEGFEGAPRGNDLIQDVGAVSIPGDQSFESQDLAANFSETGDKRVFLVFGVNVSHGVYLREGRADAKKKFGIDA